MDSKVALLWIKGEEKQWKQFVHNRVTEIRALVPAQHWSHCAGKDNPADLPSHGISSKQLETSLVWKHGPDWLPKFLPVQVTEILAMPEDCMTELKAQNTSGHTLLVVTKNIGIRKLIDCACYSKLQKLLRVTAPMRKFVTRFTKLIKHDNPLVDWMITATDMQHAEMD